MWIGLRSTAFLSKRYSEKVSRNFLCSPLPSRAFFARISHSTITANSIHIPLFRYFERQLQLASNTKLPLFLHCRNSGKDLIEILNRNYENLPKHKGVVHSFDGTYEGNILCSFASNASQ